MNRGLRNIYSFIRQILLLVAKLAFRVRTEDEIMIRMRAGKIGQKLSGLGVFLVLLLVWLGILLASDSYHSPYILYAILGLAAFMEYRGVQIQETRREKICGILFSLAFAHAVLMANYRLVDPLGEHFLSAVILLLGGYVLARLILRWTLRKELNPAFAEQPKNRLAVEWFCLSFFVIGFFDLVILFFCYKPGFLSFDSFFQINQILTDRITNHHPFWHTMIIKAALTIGMKGFQNISIGVVIYNIFQILCMAGIFAWLMMTLYQAGVPRFWLMIVLLVYIALPYHVIYSMTMWKDVLFGGSATLFVCTLFRLLRGIGRKWPNYVVIVFGALGTCLLRSNGLAAFVMTFLILTAVLWRTERKLLITLLSVILAAVILKYPVLQMLNVPQVTTAEYLSIPGQQFARLLWEEADLEDDELAELQKIMDTEKAKKNYNPILSDPVKGLINGGYVKENKLNCLGLWLRLGFKHPDVYLRAWIEQTRGYWNAGYKYWIVTEGIGDNDYGIWREDLNNRISRTYEDWRQNFFQLPVFEPFRSIGLHNWILALCATVLFVKKRREGLMCVLPITIILTLLISTPVFNEFRYDYSVIASLPFVIFATFIKPGAAS